MRVVFGDEGHPVAVEVPDALGGAVSGLFAPLVLRGWTRDEEVALVVRAEDDGFVLEGRDGRPASAAAEGAADGPADVSGDGAADGPSEGAAAPERFSTLPDLLGALEFALLLRLLEHHRGETHLHGSGALVPAGAVVALGASGAGKSSLALAWSCAGLGVLGDDLLLVEEDGTVRGFPRLVKVDRSRLAAHDLALEHTVAPDPDHDEAWFDPGTRAGWARGRYAVALLARVEYDGGATTRIEEFDAVEALRILLDNVQGAGATPEDSLDRLIVMTLGARAVDVRFGDAADAAAALAREAERRPA